MSEITNICTHIHELHEDIYHRYWSTNKPNDTRLNDILCDMFMSTLFKNDDTPYIYIRYKLQRNFTYNIKFTAYALCKRPEYGLQLVTDEYLLKLTSQKIDIDLDKAIEIFTNYKHYQLNNYVEILNKDYED